MCTACACAPHVHRTPTAYASQVHSQIAAFLYAAIAEEGISEEEARDEIDAVCLGLPTSYTWRVAGMLWEPAFLQPRIWLAWAANLLLLLLLELLLATFILKLDGMLDFAAFLQSFFYYTLVDPPETLDPNPNPDPDPNSNPRPRPRPNSNPNPNPNPNPQPQPQPYP